MGILNITPDSFSDGGLYSDRERALKHAENMFRDGAQIIDIGGESTRPGAEPVSEQEEMQRVIPLIEDLMHICPLISIDTVKASVAEEAFKAGASILNDISALRYSTEMPATAAKYESAVVLMHIKGVPRTMQQAPHYDNVLEEVRNYLKDSIAIAENAGIASDALLIDPGIGFGKRLKNNLELLRRLDEFKSLGKEILVGLSRKSFIAEVSHAPVKDRLPGTIAANTLALLNGASVFRVHDVKECRQALDVAWKIISSSNPGITDHV